MLMAVANVLASFPVQKLKTKKKKQMSESPALVKEEKINEFLVLQRWSWFADVVLSLALALAGEA